MLSSFPVVLADGMKDVRAYALKKNVDTLPAFADTIAALEVPVGDEPSAMTDAPAAAGRVTEGQTAERPADTPVVEQPRTEPVAACPNARSLVLRCLLFPLYPTLGKRDVEAVCRVLSTLP